MFFRVVTASLISCLVFIFLDMAVILLGLVVILLAAIHLVAGSGSIELPERVGGFIFV